MSTIVCEYNLSGSGTVVQFLVLELNIEFYETRTHACYIILFLLK